MKTALLYCGQARTAKLNADNHAWFLRHFRPCDIFASVADDQQANDMVALRDAIPHGKWHMEKVVQPTLPEPKETSPFHSGYPRSATPQGVLRQLWSLNRCWEYVCEQANPDDYDLFVRVRADINFMRVEVPAWPDFGLPSLCLTPYWARWNGINDRFAILGRTAAERYFTTFRRLNELFADKCPLHPETIMMENLRRGGIEPNDTLRAEFKTLRLPDSQHRDYWFIPCDISMIDLLDVASKSHP